MRAETIDCLLKFAFSLLDRISDAMAACSMQAPSIGKGSTLDAKSAEDVDVGVRRVDDHSRHPGLFDDACAEGVVAIGAGTGMLLGAGAGCAVGLQSDEDDSRTVALNCALGAGLGALLGGALGYLYAPKPVAPP